MVTITTPALGGSEDAWGPILSAALATLADACDALGEPVLLPALPEPHDPASEGVWPGLLDDAVTAIATACTNLGFPATINLPAVGVDTRMIGASKTNANLRELAIAITNAEAPPLPEWEIIASAPWIANGYNGIINWIGTAAGTQPYVNPAGTLVTVDQSSTHEDYTADKAINRDNGTGSTSAISPGIGSWWRLDFGPNRECLPTRAGIRAHHIVSHHPRNFKIQGSANGSVWDDLIVASGVGPIRDGWWSTDISGTARYRYVRVLMTGLSSSGSELLDIGEFEIWGDLYELQDAE